MTNIIHRAESDEYLVQHLEAEKKAAAVFISSGLLPKSIDSPAKVIVISEVARALKIPRIQALSSISVVNGKPSQEAQLMRALVFRSYPNAVIRKKELTNERAVIFVGRPGEEPEEFEFSWEDAKAAGLTSKDVWKKYPKDMMLARATTKGLRFKFPEVLMGVVYTPEELGEDRAMIDEQVVEGGKPQDINNPKNNHADQPPPAEQNDPNIIDAEAEDLPGDDTGQSEQSSEVEPISDAQKKQLERFGKSHIMSDREREGISALNPETDKKKATDVLTHCFRKEAVFKWWEERQANVYKLKEDFAGLTKKEIMVAVKDEAREKFSDLKTKDLLKAVGVTVKQDGDGKWVVEEEKSGQ